MTLKKFLFPVTILLSEKTEFAADELVTSLKAGGKR
jgi:hypothetical protein